MTIIVNLPARVRVLNASAGNVKVAQQLFGRDEVVEINLQVGIRQERGQSQVVNRVLWCKLRTKNS
jgi:hypothetical protein